MIHKNRVPEIDGMRIDEAHKGGFVGSLLKPISKVVKSVTGLDIAPSQEGGSAQVAAQVAQSAAQDKELSDLKKKEDARKAAMARKQGRSSLLSGSETGMLKKVLGQ